MACRGKRRNLEKIIFGFFIGDIAQPELHDPICLFAAVVVIMIATVLKFGDPSPVGFIRTGIKAPRSWLFRWLYGHRA